jgi:hypothetical protein
MPATTLKLSLTAYVDGMCLFHGLSAQAVARTSEAKAEGQAWMKIDHTCH